MAQDIPNPITDSLNSCSGQTVANDCCVRQGPPLTSPVNYNYSYNNLGRCRRTGSEPEIRLHKVICGGGAGSVGCVTAHLSNPFKRTIYGKFKRAISRSSINIQQHQATIISNQLMDTAVKNRNSYSSSTTGYSSARSSIRSCVTGANGVEEEGASFCDTSETFIKDQVPGPFLKETESLSLEKKRDLAKNGRAYGYLDRIAIELLETERDYVNDLHMIIQDYLNFLLQRRDELSLTAVDVCYLFGCVEQVFEFNRKLYLALDACRLDLVMMAQVFIDHQQGFNIYADYCTQYPQMIKAMERLLEKASVEIALKERQALLGHPLPLTAFLLKPIQRVLKYHLFLQNALKHWSDESIEGEKMIKHAINCMTSRAQEINEVKKRQEHKIRVQQLQRTIQYWGEDKTMLGDLSQHGALVLEGCMRTLGARSSRRLLLFDELLLIIKDKPDSSLICKDFIPCNNMLLVESLAQTPLAFQVSSFDNSKVQYTFLANNMEQKRSWTQALKRGILEHFEGEIPESAKKVVMSIGDNDYTSKTIAKTSNEICSKRRKSVDYKTDTRIHKSGKNQRSSSVVDMTRTCSTITSPQPSSPSFAQVRKPASLPKLQLFFDHRLHHKTPSFESRYPTKGVANGARRLAVAKQRRGVAAKVEHQRNSAREREELKKSEKIYFESHEMPKTIWFDGGGNKAEVGLRTSTGSTNSEDSAYASCYGSPKQTSLCSEDISSPKTTRDSDVIANLEQEYDNLWKELSDFVVKEHSTPTKDKHRAQSSTCRFPIGHSQELIPPGLQPPMYETPVVKFTNEPCDNAIKHNTFPLILPPKSPSSTDHSAQGQSSANLLSNKPVLSPQYCSSENDDNLNHSKDSLYDSILEWSLERKLSALNFEEGGYSSPEDDHDDKHSEPIRQCAKIRDSVEEWELLTKGQNKYIKGADAQIGNLNVKTIVKQWESPKQ